MTPEICWAGRPLAVKVFKTTFLMKILFVAQRYHPFIGGVETQTRLVAHELAKRHSVEVAAVNFAAPTLPARLQMLEDSLLAPSYKSFSDEGVAVHALTPSLMDRVRMLPIGVRALPRIQRYAYHALQRFGFRWYRAVYLAKLEALVRRMDVVHSVAGGYLGWVALEAAKRHGVPFVCTPYVHPGQHGDDPESTAYYKGADAVFALLETDRRLLLDLGVAPEKLHISGVVPLLPPSSDPVGFRERHGLQDKPIVLFVGRIVAYKGARALLDAATNVWQEKPDTHFLFIGPLDREAQGWFDGVDPRIRYLGRVSEQEKADALAACDVFSMPSNFEILPAVYLEAWSYAKPVIGGKAHGLTELIEGNQAGVTVEQNALAIAAHIRAFLGDPERRKTMGERGKALVQDRYSTEALVRIFESVYEDVCQQREVTELSFVDQVE